MSAGMEWKGLSELAKELAALPANVRGKFKPVLENAGNQVVAEATSEYSAAGVPDLAKGMRVESSPEAADLSVRIKLTHPAAHLRELGTVDRYTSKGAYRGRQPARPVFIPIVERAREQVGDKLEDGLRKLGGSHLDSK